MTSDYMSLRIFFVSIFSNRERYVLICKVADLSIRNLHCLQVDQRANWIHAHRSVKLCTWIWMIILNFCRLNVLICNWCWWRWWEWRKECLYHHDVDLDGVGDGDGDGDEGRGDRWSAQISICLPATRALKRHFPKLKIWTILSTLIKRS